MQPTHVLVFVFDPFKRNVLLIRKKRPEFMAGKLNGIGGTIEPNETPLEAVSRELYEEAGLNLDHFVHIANLTNQNNDYFVVVYSAETELFRQFETKTDELVSAYPVMAVNNHHLVSSMFTLFSMCFEVDKRVLPYTLIEA